MKAGWAAQKSACIGGGGHYRYAREIFHLSRCKLKGSHLSTNHTDAMQISRRYATAIFSLAVEAKKEPIIVGEIATLAEAMKSSPALAEAMANPTLHHAQKASVLAALCSKADALTKRAVETIAQAGRASLLPTIAEELTRRLAIHQGEAEAIITSARPLAASAQKQLAKALADATGKRVKLTLKEDAAVLGGVRIELGSLRLDATLAGALTQMKTQLLATAV